MYDDEEKVENDLAEAKMVYDFLSMTLEQFGEYRGRVSQGLAMSGNPFLIGLSKLLNEADIPNTVRILNTWRRECSEQAMLYQIYEAKERANPGK